VLNGVLDEDFTEAPELFSDLPLEFQDSFISSTEYHYFFEDFPYRNIESQIKVDAFGSISTPFGTFECLRMSIANTETFYASDTASPVVTLSYQVAWVAENGFRFYADKPSAGASGTVTLNDVDYYRIGTLPACTTLSSPANGTSNVPVNTALNWSASTGSPTGYRLDVGTTLGGGQVLNNLDAGNVTTFDPPGNLPNDDSIFVKIKPYNAFGTRSICPVEWFRTAVCIPNLTLENTNIPAGTYWSQGELMAGNNASVAAGNAVILRSDAGISLQPNFTVDLSGTLEAGVLPCPVNFNVEVLEEK
jgi:hypothetical protein